MQLEMQNATGLPLPTPTHKMHPEMQDASGLPSPTPHNTFNKY